MGKENYVLPVQKLASREELINAFEWLLANEDRMRKHLQRIMPDYRKNAGEGKKVIENLL